MASYVYINFMAIAFIYFNLNNNINLSSGRCDYNQNGGGFNSLQFSFSFSRFGNKKVLRCVPLLNKQSFENWTVRREWSVLTPVTLSTLLYAAYSVCNEKIIYFSIKSKINIYLSLPILNLNFQRIRM